MIEFGKLNHQQPFTIKGEWWIVGKSRNKVRGTLQFDPSDGIHLEADGVLRMSHWMGLFAPTVRETILGVTDDRQRMSLHNCYCTRGGPRATYLVNLVLAGTHTRKLAALRFQSFFLSLTGLEEWIGISPITSEPTADCWVRVALRSPDPITMVVRREKFEMEMDFSFGAQAGRRQTVIEFQNHITVRPRRAASWRTFNRLTTDLHRLVMLLSGEPSSARQCGGVLRRVRTAAQRDLSDDQLPPGETVYVFRKPMPQTPASSRETFTNELLFPFLTVRDRLDGISDQWFSITGKLRSMLDVLFAEFRTRSRFLEPQFFHLAQCLEAFHRITFAPRRGKRVSKRQFKLIHARIVASLPKLSRAIRPAVESALWGANAISFQDRLQQLFDDLQPETVKFITDNPPRFIQATRETRNLFTHLEKRKKSPGFARHQWPEARGKLLALLFIHLLKRCGLLEPEIIARMRESARFGKNPFQFRDPDEPEE